jgi:hypothetical protein
VRQPRESLRAGAACSATLLFPIPRCQVINPGAARLQAQAITTAPSMIGGQFDDSSADDHDIGGQHLHRVPQPRFNEPARTSQPNREVFERMVGATGIEPVTPTMSR